MNKKFILIFLIFLALISNIFSINILINGRIDDYSTSYFENVSVKLNCNEDITIQTPSNAKFIKINNILTKNSSFFIKDCNKTNYISYQLNSITQIKNNIFRLERNFGKYNSDNISYIYNLQIPLNYLVDINKTIPSKFKIINSKDHKNIVFDPNDIYVIYLNEINIEDNQFSILHIFDELSESNVLFLVILFFSLGVGLTYIYFSYKIKKIPLTQVPSFILSSEEKNILDIIKDEPGINQKQIGIKLNFSKSRVSAFINDLEQKQLIKREKFGRSFKVYLNKKIV